MMYYRFKYTNIGKFFVAIFILSNILYFLINAIPVGYLGKIAKGEYEEKIIQLTDTIVKNSNHINFNLFLLICLLICPQKMIRVEEEKPQIKSEDGILSKALNRYSKKT